MSPVYTPRELTKRLHDWYPVLHFVTNTRSLFDLTIVTGIDGLNVPLSEIDKVTDPHAVHKIRLNWHIANLHFESFVGIYHPQATMKLLSEYNIAIYTDGHGHSDNEPMVEVAERIGLPPLAGCLTRGKTQLEFWVSAIECLGLGSLLTELISQLQVDQRLGLELEQEDWERLEPVVRELREEGYPTMMPYMSYYWVKPLELTKEQAEEVKEALIEAYDLLYPKAKPYTCTCNHEDSEIH